MIEFPKRKFNNMLKFDSDKKTKEAIFKTFLKSKGLSYTFERSLILQEILKTAKGLEHFSVDSIFKRMQADKKRVSKGTIYKTLQLLEDCSIVKKTNIAPNKYIYEKNKLNSIGHLVCLECEKIFEIDEKAITDLIFDSCRKVGFNVKLHTFEIKGICFDCLNNE